MSFGHLKNENGMCYRNVILVKVSIIHFCRCFFNFINTPLKKNDTFNVHCPRFNDPCKRWYGDTFKSCIDQTFLFYWSVLQRYIFKKIIYWFSVYLTNCTKKLLGFKRNLNVSYTHFHPIIYLNDSFNSYNKTQHIYFTINW